MWSMDAEKHTLAGRFESEENMSAATGSAMDASHPLVHEEKLVRVYVWQWPLRIAHWVIFLAILVLGFTGYYMYDPFIISRGNSVFLMATMRFTHGVTAMVFISAVLLRFYWFFKGNRWAHWRSFVPLEGWWRRGIWKQIKYYVFLSTEPDSEVGHNPLAAATYMVIYALMVVEIFTGLALYDYVNGVGHGVLTFFTGWFTSLIGITYVREMHFLIMFAFLAFLVHHVYSAVLIGIEEHSGLVGGIFSGYKFFPAAFIASDPTRRPHEARIPAKPAGRSHKLRTGKRESVANIDQAASAASEARTQPPKGES
jgi:Ni/Fe-hydrogenase 1 B-type cytochrome subunit